MRPKIPVRPVKKAFAVVPKTSTPKAKVASIGGHDDPKHDRERSIRMVFSAARSDRDQGYSSAEPKTGTRKNGAPTGTFPVATKITWMVIIAESCCDSAKSQAVAT